MLKLKVVDFTNLGLISCKLIKYFQLNKLIGIPRLLHLLPPGVGVKLSAAASFSLRVFDSDFFLGFFSGTAASWSCGPLESICLSLLFFANFCFFSYTGGCCCCDSPGLLFSIGYAFYFFFFCIGGFLAAAIAAASAWDKFIAPPLPSFPLSLLLFFPFSLIFPLAPGITAPSASTLFFLLFFLLISFF